MNANILEPKKQILESLSLSYDEIGNIFIKILDSKSIWKHNGKAVVLPTDVQEESLYAMNDDGDNETVKHLFLPHKESAVGDVGVSVTKIRKQMEYVYFITACAFIEKVIIYGINHKDMKSASTTLKIMFSDGTLKYSSFTPKLLKVWLEIQKYVFENDHTILNKVLLVRQGRKEGRIYNRTASLESKLIDKLKDTDGPVYGIKMTDSQKETIIALVKVFFNITDVDDDDANLTLMTRYSVGSDSGKHPALDSLLRLHLEMAEILNEKVDIIKSLSKKDENIVDYLNPNNMSLEDIKKGYEIVSDVMLPTEDNENDSLTNLVAKNVQSNVVERNVEEEKETEGAELRPGQKRKKRRSYGGGYRGKSYSYREYEDDYDDDDDPIEVDDRGNIYVEGKFIGHEDNVDIRDVEDEVYGVPEREPRYKSRSRGRGRRRGRERYSRREHYREERPKERTKSMF